MAATERREQPDGRELAGRVALVTGAARNIGRAIALCLADAGARVVVNTRASREAAEETARMISARGGETRAIIADITDPAAVSAMMGEAVNAFGRLDILVNNAAIRSDHPIEAITFDEWRRVMASILDGTFLCVQAALVHLRASGAGSIVNIGGIAAHVGIPERAHVSAAKAGVTGLTRALAAELAADGINVNCVSPGYMETKRDGPVPPHFLARPVPVGRPGTPEELAAMVRHLVGPNGRFLTGQVIHFNGGWHMGA